MRFFLGLSLLFLALPFVARGQPGMRLPETGISVLSEFDSPNFSTFSLKRKAVTSLWKSKNPGFLNHPDAGYIAPEQPAGNVVEIFEKRTQTTRYYIDQDTPGKVFSQGAFGPLHYKVGERWLIIDHRLDKISGTELEASHQREPVGFDISKKQSYILTANGKISFNDWKLFGTKSGKSECLAAANWDKYSAGDDGVFVENIFPGVDAQMMVLKGRLKTNLIIKEWNFKDFDDYYFADSFSSPLGGRFEVSGADVSPEIKGDVDYKSGKLLLARVGKAVAYAENDAENVLVLPYTIKGRQLRIHIKKQVIVQLLKKGAVVIDPLVTGQDGIYQPNDILSSYNDANCSYDFNVGCSNTWKIPVPPLITVTNAYFKFLFQTFAPCTRDKFRFKYGFGQNFCGTGIQWFTIGLPKTLGITGGNISDTQGYNNCFKPGCELTYIDATLSTVRACMGPDGCESTCVQGIGPFVTTIEGRTLEMVSINAEPDPLICNSDTVKLSALADFGVKPYTYQWLPVNQMGSQTVVAPIESTTYKVVVTDACKQAVSASLEAVVPAPLPQMKASITGPREMVCPGEPITFNSQITNADQIAYQWMVNGVDVYEADQPNFTSSELVSSDLISLRITNNDLCANPKILITDPVSPLFYQGVYEQPLVIHGCGSVEFEKVKYLDDTRFSRLLKSRFGCDSVKQIIQIDVEHFKVNLSADRQSDFYDGDLVNLKVSSEDDGFNVIGWHPPSFFEDQSSVEQNVSIHSPAAKFVVQAISENGCEDSASISLRVLAKPFGNLLPNVFTPNADGLNDLWEPLKKSEFPVAELFVYNRWGACIYHTTDYTNAWNGTYKGERVPVGVYPYKLIVGNKFEIEGAVTIVY